ncbi:MAG: 30S ribosomal protein S17 [Vampirovibrionales bacterium]|nr:30S ribosomal protein S17 [Vampirovibrionales bacterium]
MPRREKIGKVVSSKMDKTVVVLVTDRIKHPKYGKVTVVSQKFMAHDEANDTPEGALVRIREDRPRSRRKRWMMVEILERPVDLAAV